MHQLSQQLGVAPVLPAYRPQDVRSADAALAATEYMQVDDVTFSDTGVGACRSYCWFHSATRVLIAANSLSVHVLVAQLAAWTLRKRPHSNKYRLFFFLFIRCLGL